MHCLFDLIIPLYSIETTEECVFIYNITHIKLNFTPESWKTKQTLSFLYVGHKYNYLDIVNIQDVLVYIIW